MPAIIRATLLVTFCVVVATAQAFGQSRKPPPLTDLQAITKLHELTRAKGDYVKRLGPGFCRRLGVRPIGFCEAFEAKFAADSRPAAAFYSLDDGRTGTVRIFITTHLEQGYVEDYRVDVEGRLDRAVRRRGDASSHISVQDGLAGFKRVMNFLRDKPDEVAGWPDAAIVEDGSCPKGQVKRVPRDAANAVCLDRKRLKLN